MATKVNQAVAAAARKEFLALVGQYDEGNLSPAAFYNESVKTFYAPLSEGPERQLEMESWLIPMLTRKRRKELLVRQLRHLRKSSCLSEQSMHELAARYQFSVATVCSLARNESILVKSGPLRPGRAANLTARRPLRILNFAYLLWLVVREEGRCNSFSTAEWRRLIIEIFRAFLPRPVTSLSRPVRNLPLSFRRVASRPVKYKTCVVVDPRLMDRTCRLYLNLFMCRNFMEAWDEIEKIRWMRLPGYVGLVNTDCVLDGPPLIFETAELLPPNEFFDFGKPCRESNARAYFRALHIKEIRAASASNVRRFIRITESLGHAPGQIRDWASNRGGFVNPARKLDRRAMSPSVDLNDDPTDEEWAKIFARAQDDVGAN
jgi:hypothetical protein